MSADPVGLLRRLVAIDSVFPNEKELAHLLAKALEARGFSVELQRCGGERYNVLGAREASASAQDTKPGTGNPGHGARDPRPGTQGAGPLLLYGHMDTVPAYGYEQEGRDPFKLEERDGRLYGLGAYDMKAGIAAVLQALDGPSPRDIKAMFVSDEENDSRGCHEAAKSGFLDGCAFALVPEISDVSDISESTRTITLGRRGRAQFEFRVPGLACHAANLERGISAVSQSARLALRIEQDNATLPAHPHLVRGNQFVRALESSSVSLSVPDQARLIVDRHLVPGEDEARAEAMFRQMIDSMYADGSLLDTQDSRRTTVSLRPREVPYLMPYETERGHPEVRRLSALIEDGIGKEARYNYGMSVADENLIAMQGVPVASLGPIGDGEHSSKEWVSKKSYLELIDLVSAFVQG